MEKIKEKKWYQKLVNWHVFFVAFLSECFEEVLEELFATVLSWIVTKSLTLLFAIAVTQGSKLLFKRIIKCFTYKEGNDKMKKFKKVMSNLKKKLTENIVWSNKITISGWLSVLLMVLEGTDIVNVIDALPELQVFGFNVIPYIVYLILLILSALGIGKPGVESVKQYLERIQAKKDTSKSNAQTKAAEKEIEKIKKQKLAAMKQELEDKAKAEAEEEYKKKMLEEVK